MVSLVSYDDQLQALAAQQVAQNVVDQAEVAASVALAVALLWRRLKFKSLDTTAIPFMEAALPKVADGFYRSQQLSSDLFRTLESLQTLSVDHAYRPPGPPRLVRPEALVRPHVRVRVETPAVPFNERLAGATLLSAGPGRVWQSLPAPEDEAMGVGLKSVVGAAQRLALDGGREQTERDMQSSSLCVGWQRVTDDDPCYFCALLASKGPDYKSGLAFARSNRKFSANSVFNAGEPEGIAKVHNHCRCTLVPVFEAFEFSQPIADDALVLWDKTSDFPARQRMNEYRKLFEKKYGTKSKSTGVVVDDASLAATAVEDVLVAAGNSAGADFVRSLKVA